MLAATIFAVLEFGVAFFEKITGKLYPYSKYDTVFVVDNVFNAMENPGLVMISEHWLQDFEASEVKKIEFLLLILHELSHMWFGKHFVTF